MSPTFIGDTYDYTLTVDYEADRISLTPIEASSGSTIAINGSVVASGTAGPEIPSIVGHTPVHLTVLSPDGISSTSYSVVVTRLTRQESWRKLYFGDPANVGDSADSKDFDGDGMASGDEYVFGTNPTDPTSRIALTIEGVNTSTGEVQLSITPIRDGRIYTLRAKARLDSSEWVPTSNQTIEVDGERGSISDVDGFGGRKFYILEVDYP
jgi:hypothetical protein